jgi:signal transduction histidine kinase
MPGKGTLTVSTRLAENGSQSMRFAKDETKSNGYIEIEVADTGIGMSQEFIKQQLFRPFQTTKNKGLGIGLFQCREAIEAHGGQIDVKSSEGEGTVFSIRLPVIHSSAEK